jgi:transcriptional regulator of acetoin/glycerol metabolism
VQVLNGGDYKSLPACIMIPPTDADLLHARALRGRGAMLPPGHVPSGEILESWARCLDRGLDYAARLALPVVDAAELARRREHAGAVRRLAHAELETLVQQIAGSNFLLAFADADGVVLDVLADNRFAMSSNEDIVAGSCWREDVAGTNGLGTALALGRGVAVTGPEHYYLRLADVSCTASPIRDAQGHVVGLIDASSFVEARQRHTQALVQMSTTHIENMLLAEQRAGDLLVAIHPRREFLRTISAGLLAFDGEGRLTALNARASALLAGLEAHRGASFEQLFGERFTAFVARLGIHGETRFADQLGSTLLARWVGPRPGTAATAAGRQWVAAPAAPVKPQAHAPAASIDYLADDPAVAEALRLATQAFGLRVPLLATGEPGSGKERLVREAHAAAGVEGTIVAAHCATLSEDRLAGLWRDSAGQTLLLDNVGEMPAPQQAQLLRLLDDAASGGARPSPRLAATTQTALEGAAQARRFRVDLLYRLAGVAVAVPPLRARKDFEACARLALARVAPRAHLDPRALKLLARQPWHGNWHELSALLTRGWLAAAGGLVDAAVPVLVDAQHLAPLLPAADTPSASLSILQREATDRVLRELEHQGGSISRTARRLGVSRNTVYRHLRAAKRTSS